MDIATCRLLARYNDWMNRKLILAAAALPDDELDRDRGAFFGSVLGTLNHLIVADTLWLKRLSAHPACAAPLAPLDDIAMPASLDARPCPTLDALRTRRETLDALFVALCGQLEPAALDTPLDYRNTRGEPFRRPLGELLLHVFNHQTHHRGQATTLLSQAGVDVGVTDLLALLA